MAAARIFENTEVEELLARPYLHLVTTQVGRRPLHHGRSLAERRVRRANRARRRQRTLIGVVLLMALSVLALPGSTFGATTGAGISTAVATSSVLASGMVYVVQPGQSVVSIARAMNPVDPSMARALLVAELHSSVVVPGEHVLIP